MKILIAWLILVGLFFGGALYLSARSNEHEVVENLQLLKNWETIIKLHEVTK